MGSFLKFLALCVFAAGGVGIAICMATSLPMRPASARSSHKAGDPPATPDASQSPAPRQPAAGAVKSTEAAVRIEPASAVEPPQAEFPAPAAPPVAPPPGTPTTESGLSQPIALLAQTPNAPLPDLGDIGNAILKEVLNQQKAQDKQEGEIDALKAPVPPKPNPSQGNAAGEEDEEGAENSGGATQRKTATQLPSSFTVSKLPTAGDDRLSVHIQNKDLREVLDFLGEHGGLSILASPNVQGTVSVSLTDVTIEQALAAILKSTGYVSRREGKFIYVGTADDITSMAQSIDRIETRVYRPNYVKAADLEPLITPLLSPAGSASSGSSAALVAVSPPAETGIAADGSASGGDAFAEGEVIVVRDYISVLDEIDQVIAEIDKRPMQVAIEAMLLSVELNDSNSFGVDFQFLRDKQNIRLATGSPLANLANLSFSTGGLKFGFLDSTLGAFVSALQTIGDTNVIASPRLMCLNKQKAEILIGQQLGYVTKTLTQTTTAQTVEFLEVGTQLRLRPYISTDGLIRMEVHPELSTGSVEVKEGFTLPNKQVTQVTTNIMVRDGCTVVIGGLMQENLAQTGNQVPLIGSMPGIGFLFRNRTGTQKRNEIIVLITPHIVYEPESCIEGDQAAADFHRHQSVYRDEFAQLNSRYVGRKFFRLAQRAWANNDKQAAMKFINMSIHFDPQNRASINLRADILANNHFGQQSGIVPLPEATPAEAVDAAELAPWVLDDLEGGAVDFVPEHPRDPGQPARVVPVARGSEFR